MEGRIMTTSMVSRTRGRSPSPYRQSNCDRKTDDVDVLEKSLQSSHVIGVDRPRSEDEIASLVFLGSDDTSSDDSSFSGYAFETTSGRRRRLRKDRNNENITNDIECYTNAKTQKECEVGKYMAAREMTPFQERMNALTVLPSTYYCIMFFLSGSWLSKSFIEEHVNGLIDYTKFDVSQCIHSTWFPNLHALPPAAPVAAAVGILCHAPFSMIYHWRYAHRLPPGLPRTTHWSRRMDQAMIHFCCACLSYASSGRFDFFFVNALFNAECMYLLFLEKVVPKRNQKRIAMSILLFAIPILHKGDFASFSKLIVIFALAGWLFGGYPIGGWSHAAFHIVLAFVPPVMFAYALNLPASLPQLDVAARCAIMSNDSLV